MRLHRKHCECIAAYEKDHSEPLVDWPEVQHPVVAKIVHTKQAIDDKINEEEEENE